MQPAVTYSITRSFSDDQGLGDAVFNETRLAVYTNQIRQDEDDDKTHYLIPPDTDPSEVEAIFSLQIADNIVERLTDMCQGQEVYLALAVDDKSIHSSKVAPNYIQPLRKFSDKQVIRIPDFRFHRYMNSEYRFVAFHYRRVDDAIQQPYILAQKTFSIRAGSDAGAIAIIRRYVEEEKFIALGLPAGTIHHVEQNLYSPDTIVADQPITVLLNKRLKAMYVTINGMANKSIPDVLNAKILSDILFDICAPIVFHDDFKEQAEYEGTISKVIKDMLLHRLPPELRTWETIQRMIAGKEYAKLFSFCRYIAGTEQKLLQVKAS